jgi:hypothetical protein
MIVELRNKILESSEIDPKAPVRTIVEPFKTSLDIGSAVGAGVSGNAGRIPLANSSQMPLQSSSLDAGDGKKKDSKSHRAGGSGSNTATGGVKSSKAASQKKKAADASLEEISLAPPDDLAVGSEGGSVKKAKGSGAGSSKKAPKSPTNKASSPKSAKEHAIDLTLSAPNASRPVASTSATAPLNPNVLANMQNLAAMQQLAARQNSGLPVGPQQAQVQAQAQAQAQAQSQNPALAAMIQPGVGLGQQQFIQFVVKQRPEIRQRIYELLQHRELSQQAKVDMIARLIRESNAASAASIAP